MIVLSWVATTFSVLGSVLVSAKRVVRGLETWTVANVLWIVWAVGEEQWSSLVMFAVFFVTSAWGRWNWRQEAK